MKKLNNDILIIPDGHAHPEYDNDRFDWLGRLILETRPGTVVCIGDLGDFPSLSSYDEGTRNAWGKLYKLDVASVVDAQERIWGPTDEFNRRRAANKKAQYKPRRVNCKGNHEDRADRFVNRYPAMDGFVDVDTDMQIERFWDDNVGFKSEIEVHGVSFSHYFANGLTGNAISGVNIARSMAIKLSRSAVQGHSHVLSYNYTDRGPDKPRIECWSCGCYSHTSQVEGWNRNTVAMWRYGILHLHNVVDGVAVDGWTWHEMAKLRRLYEGS